MPNTINTDCSICEEDFDECYHEGDFTVRFTGDYFSLTTALWATSFEQAERLANQNLLNEYGWDVAQHAEEIETTLEGVLNA